MTNCKREYGCPNPATQHFTWPGQPESELCDGCMAHMLKSANAALLNVRPIVAPVVVEDKPSGDAPTDAPPSTATSVTGLPKVTVVVTEHEPPQDPSLVLGRDLGAEDHDVSISDGDDHA